MVATFIQTYPKIVVKLGDTKFIPYDGVAFIVEVKKTMDKVRLEQDLIKLDKVSKLHLSSNRLGGITQGDLRSIDRPLRILFYFESSIDDTVRHDLLLKYNWVWDVILIIQKNELLSNRRENEQLSPSVSDYCSTSLNCINTDITNAFIVYTIVYTYNLWYKQAVTLSSS